MNVKQFSDAMSELDSKYIDEAVNYQMKTRKPVWVSWGAIAACLCLAVAVAGVAAGAVMPRLGKQDTVPVPMITLQGKNYVAPDMPVNKLPEEYHYLRDLTEKEAKNTGLEGCAIYVDPQDKEMRTIYLYQECGTPIDEYTLDNTQRQWAYVQWIAIK